MSPDKLFDYLEGKLPRFEREQLEQRLAEDAELQRELRMARTIHERMSGDSREVLLDGDPDKAERGRRIVKNIAIVFILLLGLNVATGLWLIARHESASANRKQLEARERAQISKSLNLAAKNNLTPSPIGPEQITVPAASGKLNEVADNVAAAAIRLGGSATKELPENHRVGMLVDVPADRESEFRSALAAISGAVSAPPAPVTAASPASEKKSFIIYVTEPGAVQR
jgi:anti-sigma factor RsiW